MIILRLKNFQIILILILVLMLIITIANKKNNLSENYDVKIGVIDSTIENKYINKYRNITMYEDKLNYDSDTIHGAITLSLILKNNYDTKVFYAPVLNSKLEANIQEIVNAIYWCVSQNVDIINMSFSTLKDDKELKKAIEYALDNNIIVVASCMNYYSYESYPANYEGVISVSEGDYKNAKIVLNKKEYIVELNDGTVIKSRGTSCATAYITNKIINIIEFYGKGIQMKNIINKIKT